ncbi:hypothetical protein B0H14DRAFT_2640703 [Mycena olivaceomarginata]|nr:hypothetical protein B0H14DRAFT_2640703 [Mycena olivaceomarginata]
MTRKKRPAIMATPWARGWTVDIASHTNSRSSDRQCRGLVGGQLTSHLTQTHAPQIGNAAVSWVLGAGKEFYEHVILVRCHASLKTVFSPSLEEFRLALLSTVIPLWMGTTGAALAPITRPVRKGQFVCDVTPKWSYELNEIEQYGGRSFKTFQARLYAWEKLESIRTIQNAAVLYLSAGEDQNPGASPAVSFLLVNMTDTCSAGDDQKLCASGTSSLPLWIKIGPRPWAHGGKDRTVLNLTPCASCAGDDQSRGASCAGDDQNRGARYSGKPTSAL